MSNDQLEAVKGYLRIDFDDDDVIIDGFISAAKQYLINAGVPDQPDNELYKLVVNMMVSMFYENRNVADKDMKLPTVVMNFITQLSVRVV
ncbi:phage gp6-like head-tail connector protein [Paenibacillus sp. MMS18-CY102]|nr:head-tail connector protein [Paenibacillus sp. MMS18-CY102]MWC26638.1 phage gp6-like head-tail connector protein [Paenibacillus sp. MMS18-CY102]